MWPRNPPADGEHPHGAGAAEALRSRTAQLERAGRELEGFFYAISHDLRSPLRGIDGWSQALLEDCSAQLDETARGYLDRMRSEVRRMETLFDGLLQLSRLSDATGFEPFDLGALACRVAERLARANPERRIEFDIQKGLTVVGNPRLLETALWHLLQNACKFTGNRALARIEFGCALDRDTETGSMTRIYHVQDNGIGFDTAHASRLFGLYQRMHRASEFPGTGIGLAAVQRIVHRHGGRIWAQARPDDGALFRFTLGAGEMS